MNWRGQKHPEVQKPGLVPAEIWDYTGGKFRFFCGATFVLQGRCPAWGCGSSSGDATQQSQFFSGSCFVVNKCSCRQGQRSGQELRQCLLGFPAKEAVIIWRFFCNLWMLLTASKQSKREPQLKAMLQLAWRCQLVRASLSMLWTEHSSVCRCWTCWRILDFYCAQTGTWRLKFQRSKASCLKIRCLQ